LTYLDEILREYPDLAPLVAAAQAVRANAYAPYSGFAVGSALRGKSGKIYVGVNVENASYPVGVCAERSAVSQAVGQGEREFDEIVVVTDAAHAAAPCGFCRQCLAEFGLDLQVTAIGKGGIARRTTLRDLLPQAFTPDSFEPMPGRKG